MKPFDLEKIASSVGYVFRDSDILEQIFTHDSYANEHNVKSYQRLEFLGDSVVNFAVAQELYRKYPDKGEGWLTKVRSKIVKNKGALANVTERMGILHYLRTSSGDAEKSVVCSPKVKADLFEAIAGGICLDSGIERAVEFVVTHLKEELNREYTDLDITDFKSLLYETCAKRKIASPKFINTPDATGAHVEVFIDGELVGVGAGSNRSEAENCAAEKAYRLKFSD